MVTSRTSMVTSSHRGFSHEPLSPISQAMREAGALAFLLKPSSTAVLAETIRRLRSGPWVP